MCKIFTVHLKWSIFCTESESFLIFCFCFVHHHIYIPTLTKWHFFKFRHNCDYVNIYAERKKITHECMRTFSSFRIFYLGNMNLEEWCVTYCQLRNTRWGNFEIHHLWLYLLSVKIFVYELNLSLTFHIHILFPQVWFTRDRLK
jgi:hypothetical protein